MPGRIKRLSAREVEAILQSEGFVLVGQRGSHRKWSHPATGRKAVVPRHGGQTLPTGTTKAILEGADVPEEKWRE